MSVRYGIFYRGLMAESHLTRLGAQSRAYSLSKIKGWDFAQVTVREVLK